MGVNLNLQGLTEKSKSLRLSFSYLIIFKSEVESKKQVGFISRHRFFSLHVQSIGRSFGYLLNRTLRSGTWE